MARTVADVALMLSAMAGPDPSSPISISESSEQFREPLARDFKGVRIAWSSDFGGLPIDPRVSTVLESQRHVFTDLGCEVEEACPDLSDAYDAFQVQRAAGLVESRGPLLEKHRHQMKDTAIWNIEKGLALTGADIGRAGRLRTAVFKTMTAFMERYQFLVVPVNGPPYHSRSTLRDQRVAMELRRLDSL